MICATTFILKVHYVTFYRNFSKITSPVKKCVKDIEFSEILCTVAQLSEVTQYV